ncbi:gp53-like domain-containing protein [Rhizosaccharibacter radicis]|uniref:Putative tail fiber protein gp53-like C-terminal domain-containing protein n=1 Tax=Rhizosaccharibacter radicis TaxID=2782605 RepID=A0ABT1VYQ1_9PROT|nr:hypothetical protein [Acetobacteraceae bacterium KSS12]
MYRIDDTTAVANQPNPPSDNIGQPGYFTGGNAASGLPATRVRYWWLNQLQEENMAWLAAASITPSKGSNGQVLQAARALFGTTYARAGASTMMLPSGLIVQSFGTPGVTLGAANQAVSFNVTYPIAFPNACIAIWARDNGNACITWGSFQNPGNASAQGWVWSSAAGSGNSAAGAVTAIGY